MSSWLWVAAGVWVVTVGLCLLGRWRRRREPDVLRYEFEWPPLHQSVADVSRAMMRMGEAFRWGSSTDMWSRRCDASLAASRARRGLR